MSEVAAAADPSGTGDEVGATLVIVWSVAEGSGVVAANRLFAGAGSMSPSSTMETPVHATTTAAVLPASQRRRKPMLLITCRVCLILREDEFKAALKES